MGRKTKGRQKIEMAKMQNPSNLQVTFSKRRAGLFNKASELSTLCGAEIAVIVASPAGNMFSFGSPNVESVIGRFLHNNPHESNQPTPTRRNPAFSELNSQLNQVENDLHAENKHKKEMEKLRKPRQNMCWWENSIDQMSLEQVGQLKGSLVGLKNKVEMEIEKARLQMIPFLHHASSNQGGGDGGIPFVQLTNGESSSHARGGGGILPYVQLTNGSSSSHARGGGGMLPFIQDSDGASSSYVTGGGGTLPRDRMSALFNSDVMFGYGAKNSRTYN